MPIPREDHLHDVYDRVQEREPSEEVQSDVRAMERALAQRQSTRQAIADEDFKAAFGDGWQ